MVKIFLAVFCAAMLFAAIPAAAQTRSLPAARATAQVEKVKIGFQVSGIPLDSGPDSATAMEVVVANLGSLGQTPSFAYFNEAGEQISLRRVLDGGAEKTSAGIAFPVAAGASRTLVLMSTPGQTSTGRATGCLWVAAPASFSGAPSLQIRARYRVDGAVGQVQKFAAPTAAAWQVMVFPDLPELLVYDGRLSGDFRTEFEVAFHLKGGGGHLSTLVQTPSLGVTQQLSQLLAQAQSASGQQPLAQMSQIDWVTVTGISGPVVVIPVGDLRVDPTPGPVFVLKPVRVSGLVLR